MTYTPGFLYDIYISHAPEDDKAQLLSPLKGWVGTLEKNLEMELSRRNGETVSIRRSQQASEFGFQGQPNKVAIKRSAVFLVVTSAHYFPLDYQQELEEFVLFSAREITDEKLVMPVLYQTCKIPRELKMIQCFDFTSVSLDDEENMGQLLRDLRAQKNRTKNKPEQSAFAANLQLRTTG